MHFAKRKTGAFLTLGIKSGLPDCNLSVMIVYHVTYFLKSKPRFTTVALVTHSGEGRTGGVYIIYWHAPRASDVTVMCGFAGIRPACAFVGWLCHAAQGNGMSETTLGLETERAEREDFTRY